MSLAPITIVMGVAGCGKSTLAAALAAASGGRYIDADDYHSAANKQKMAAGVALSDADRAPWLAAVNAELQRHASSGPPVFVACSALRERYRARLAEGLPSVRWLYLRISAELARQRITARAATGHYMPAALVASQFAALEEPTHPCVISLDASEPIAALLAQALRPLPSGS